MTAASVSDNAGGIHLLAQISATTPRVTTAWADTGYRTKAINHCARLRIDVEVVQRDPGVKGFKVIPRRWVVERTFGWLMHHRRLARDYETHPHRSEAIIHVAMIDVGDSSAIFMISPGLGAASTLVQKHAAPNVSDQSWPTPLAASKAMHQVSANSEFGHQHAWVGPAQQ
ncbi:transposase [Streptomyces afghaniensis]|nr:transposase [Streptomyces afghaniensis]